MSRLMRNKIAIAITAILVCFMVTDSAMAKKRKKGGSSSKYGRKGAKARKAWLQIPAKEYDPNTKAVCDRLWMRVHEENCPMLTMKELKKTITLEQADKEGWRIGESGQSGRSRCCFKGYRRKHPEKDITDDTIGIVQKMKSGKWKYHMAGCHRFKVSRDNKVMKRKEAKALPGYYMCTHCTERGPSATYVDAEKLAKMPTSGTAFVPYVDSLAAMEEFMGRRFFFGYSGAYKSYRSTGDKSALDSLLQEARYFHKICVMQPSVAALKARDPEHSNYLFPMVGWSRVTMQLARKGKATQKEIAEAEAFLKAIVAALKPAWESSDLDPQTGVPKKLANDFRRRAFNRAANGIGMVATASKALEDLQAVKKTKTYQPTIDRYRKCVQVWIKTWKEFGCLYTEADGKKYFYYPYAPRKLPRNENGLMTGGADDRGHYSYAASGATLMFEAAPELGADDEFMTAIANAIYHNSTTKNGSIQCPSADKIKPCSRKPWGKNPIGTFYIYEAFRDGVIEGQNRHQSAAAKKAAASMARGGSHYWHYLKALRKDRTLIHLGEKKQALTKGPRL